MVNKDIINTTINNKVDDSLYVKDSTPDTSLRILHECHSNVVSEEKLKEIQRTTLGKLRDFLSKTYGPMGSYTAIISGSGPKDIQTTYSKDGLKVLKNILFDSPIELAIQEELRTICEYVEKVVGDGTTSAVILSSLIYEGLLDVIKKHNAPQRRIVKEFSKIVKIMQDLIATNRRDITVEDICKICMISTNGNEIISEQIMNLYKEYGTNVNIDVDISNDHNTKIKTYDGLTINEGYSDAAYINNPKKGTSEIHNPKIYAFQDPVDTPEMISFFEKIVIDNIIMPNNRREEMIPTVIVCPMISRDGNGLLTQLIEMLHQCDVSKMTSQKPPILILTNIHGIDEDVAHDITRLCNCKHIRKYINPEVQQHEQEVGNAPTLETIHNFAGTCELVVADVEKTNFINTYDFINNDNRIYDSIINFLKSEIKNAEETNQDTVTIGRLKKRLRCLESNMIEFLVGGISVSDRDSLKDLVEDAVKNCSSAAEYGVGRAANFEGLLASYNILVESEASKENTITSDIIKVIFRAYYEATRILYSTVLEKDKVDDYVNESINRGAPFNVAGLFNGHTFDNKDVLTSIRTDIEILDAISKIITMMVTSNQCLLQTTSLNRY